MFSAGREGTARKRNKVSPGNGVKKKKVPKATPPKRGNFSSSSASNASFGESVRDSQVLKALFEKSRKKFYPFLPFFARGPSKLNGLLSRIHMNSESIPTPDLNQK
ncbi:hypothetical protein AVEN_235245-1 [Araneus ventricosus]|uniref:Uncharacterized protein n=1 Tax=Araneus ventricosus TaxID=182803 RepID=A0A4Y2A314_ARAVE|nr:hypothetical protein AVEN_235245-1 [Araneus ventricosus]